MGKKIKVQIYGRKYISKNIEKLIKNLSKLILPKSFLEVNVIFTDSKNIKKINSKIFKSNKLTDVITLTYCVDPNHKLGEIFISVPQAIKNSKIYNVSKETEILILVTHGLLHLIGYNDKTSKDFKKMNILTLKNLNKLL
ncbi:MAG: rRNA maturation RNase YbeY [Elusimicrobiales bacterium]|nr:rRNA maturation RNase YbeY [Elusimicrobiales bacterium]